MRMAAAAPARTRRAAAGSGWPERRRTARYRLSPVVALVTEESGIGHGKPPIVLCVPGPRGDRRRTRTPLVVLGRRRTATAFGAQAARSVPTPRPQPADGVNLRTRAG